MTRDTGDISSPAPVTPAETVGRLEAARLLGVAPRTLGQWEHDGRVRCSKWSPLPSGKPGRCRVYAVADLLRLREEFERLAEPYPDPDRPGCYRVPVMSYTTAKYEAIIDAESLPLVIGKRWNWMPRSDGLDAVVVLSAATPPQTPLRRIITGLAGREWRISHANGDPLDCRLANLVVRNIKEQLWGTRKHGSVNGRVYTSRFKGVYWNTRRERWEAKIQIDGKQKYLGRFRSETDAAMAYDEAARQLFGPHARLNFPDDPNAAITRAA